MGLILILFKTFSFIIFFLLVRKFFAHFSTALFLSVLFLIIPWQTQSGQFQISQSLGLIITSLFFLIVYKNKRMPDFKKFTMLFIFFFLSSMLLVINNFPANKLPFVLNQQEITHINLYQNIMNPVNPTLSRFYSNKATDIIKNMEVNFFESFDLNYYFFANHPLERVGVKETEKLYSWLLPLFILGCVSLNIITYGPIILWVSFVFLFSSLFSNRFSEITILLMIPYLLIIGVGVEKTRRLLRKNEIKV